MSTDQIGSGETEDVSSDPILELRNVSVSFPSGRGEARTLNDITFDIERGESLGIVGESGSGKSMLAAALLDSVVEPGVVNGDVIYRPEDEEEINITDLEEGRLRAVRWERIATVPQGAMSSFNPTRDIENHFEETLSAHARDVGEGMERARELLADLNLDPDEMLESFAHELSGGQKQRILIALGLLLDPDVLVMDEPTGALDLLMQKQILNLLHQIKSDYDITIVFISHDLPVVMSFVERLAIMYAFEIVEVGGSRRILESASHPYTRALLKSTPNLNTAVEDIQAIEGESPDPVNIPSGCSYHPRCPLADDRCELEDPELTEIEGGHRAACFYWDQAEDEIPLPFGGDDE